MSIKWRENPYHHHNHSKSTFIPSPVLLHPFPRPFPPLGGSSQTYAPPTIRHVCFCVLYSTPVSNVSAYCTYLFIVYHDSYKSNTYRCFKIRREFTSLIQRTRDNCNEVGNHPSFHLPCFQLGNRSECMCALITSEALSYFCMLSRVSHSTPGRWFHARNGSQGAEFCCSSTGNNSFCSSNYLYLLLQLIKWCSLINFPLSLRAVVRPIFCIQTVHPLHENPPGTLVHLDRSES